MNKKKSVHVRNHIRYRILNSISTISAFQVRPEIVNGKLSMLKQLCDRHKSHKYENWIYIQNNLKPCKTQNEKIQTLCLYKLKSVCKFLLIKANLCQNMQLCRARPCSYCMYTNLHVRNILWHSWYVGCTVTALI